MCPGVCALLCTAHRISEFSNWTVIQQTISNLLTYSKDQRPSWESNRFTASQEIPRSVCNPKVHYHICNARHLSLSWARSVQSMPLHPPSWRSILILSYHLRLGLPSVFPSGFSTKNPVYTSPLPHTCYMPRPSHSSRFDHPNNIYKLSPTLALIICILQVRRSDLVQNNGFPGMFFIIFFSSRQITVLYLGSGHDCFPFHLFFWGGGSLGSTE